MNHENVQNRLMNNKNACLCFSDFGANINLTCNIIKYIILSQKSNKMVFCAIMNEK